MRTDSPVFSAYSNSESAQPVCVVQISFSSADSDQFYLTSHESVSVPTTGVAHQNCISAVSTTTQRLNVSEFSSTIGAINIEAVDDGSITSVLRAKLGEGKTTSKNKLRLYVGYAGMLFSEMPLAQTQVIKEVEYASGKMKITCLDVQRETKKTIFDPKATVLSANYSIGSVTMSVQTTNGFNVVWHGPSYTTSPSQDVGYVVLGDSDGEYEIFKYTGKTANTFTGVEGGQFGTIKRAWAAVDSEGDSEELEVKEFIYLELPAVKLAYAILTGSLYGDAGKHIPDHWHLGIDEQWISTAQFVNIGADLWNPADDTKGVIVYLAGLESQDGRQFVNKQLLALAGCFMPVLSTGELGLKRISSIISTAAHVALLDERNVVDVGGVRYAQDEVVNNLRVDWSFDFTRNDYRRTSEFFDGASTAIYGLRAGKLIELKTLSGTRHSRDALKTMWESLRDRFSGEPIYTKLKLTPEMNRLEVGDIVRVNLQNWPDYTDTANINRAFEVQSVSVDWLKGEASVDLFGSSAKAAVVSDDGSEPENGAAIQDSFYSAGGVDIESAFPGAVSRSGSLVTLNSSITFTGATSLATAGVLNSASVLRVNGDFQIATSATLNVVGNCALKVKGFLQNNGTIRCTGGGAGGDYRRTYFAQQYTDSLINPTPAIELKNYSNSYPAASQGNIHARMHPQGPVLLRFLNPSGTANDRYMASTGQVDGYITLGGFSGIEQTYNAGDPAQRNVSSSSASGAAAVPTYALTPDVVGFPESLVGGGGPQGGHIYYVTYAGLGLSSATITASVVAHGSNGGAGGGGLVTISRGMAFGASGKIVTSGANAASDCGSYAIGTETFYAGRGCGGSPGAWVCIIDGADSTPPIVTGGNFEAYYGDGTSIGTPFNSNSAFMSWAPSDNPTGNNWASPHLSTSQVLAGVNLWDAMHRVQFVVKPTTAPGEETPASTISADPGVPVLTQNINTPATPEGNLVSVDVYVPPPSPAGLYSHSIVEWRYQSQTAWNRIPEVAQDETVISGLPANGAVVVVRASAVSTYGIENQSGPTQTITLNNASSPSGYALEFGYDSSTNTFIRVVDTSSGDSVASVGADGSGFNDGDRGDSTDLIYNGNHKLSSADLTPAGIIGESNSLTPTSSVVGWHDRQAGIIKITAPSLVEVGCIYKAFKVDQGTKYKISFSIMRSVTNTWSVACYALGATTTQLPEQVEWIRFSSSNPEDGFSSATVVQNNFALLFSGSVGTSWEDRELTYSPPAGTKWASLYFQKTGNNNSDLRIRNVSCVPIINSDADKTETAINAGITTTGELILSTDGVVRTEGKTSVTDGVEGVLLGDISGNKSFYAGDGINDYISYKEGRGLEIGQNTRLLGAASINVPDVTYYGLRNTADDFSVRGTPSGVTYSDGAVIIEMNTGVTAGTYGGIRQKTTWPRLCDGATQVMDSQFDSWYMDRTLVAAVDIGIVSGVIYCVGIGEYSNNSSNMKICALFKNEEISVIRADGTNEVETVIYSGPYALGATIVTIDKKYSSATVTVKGGNYEISQTFTDNIPNGTTLDTRSATITVGIFVIQPVLSADRMIRLGEWKATRRSAAYVGTVALLHFEGANGATSFINSAVDGGVIPYGNAQISTAQHAVGSSSALFDGAGDYLVITNPHTLNFGLGDFTIECWIRKTSNTNEYQGVLCSDFSTWGPDCQVLLCHGTVPAIPARSGKIGLERYGTLCVESTTVTAINTWYHVAISKNKNTLRLFINGIQEDSAVDTNYWLFNNAKVGWTQWQPASGYFSGYIDEMRITKGIGRYTANFTPPTAPLGLD